MNVNTAIKKRIENLCKKEISIYALSYRSGVPQSALKSILSEKSKIQELYP